MNMVGWPAGAATQGKLQYLVHCTYFSPFSATAYATEMLSIWYQWYCNPSRYWKLAVVLCTVHIWIDTTISHYRLIATQHRFCRGR